MFKSQSIKQNDNFENWQISKTLELPQAAMPGAILKGSLNRCA